MRALWSGRPQSEYWRCHPGLPLQGVEDGCIDAFYEPRVPGGVDDNGNSGSMSAGIKAWINLFRQWQRRVIL